LATAKRLPPTFRAVSHPKENKILRRIRAWNYSFDQVFVSVNETKALQNHGRGVRTIFFWNRKIRTQFAIYFRKKESNENARAVKSGAS
jgi:hypothetical protein